MARRTMKFYSLPRVPRCPVLILLTSPELTVFCRELEQRTMSGKVTKKLGIEAQKLITLL